MKIKKKTLVDIKDKIYMKDIITRDIEYELDDNDVWGSLSKVLYQHAVEDQNIKYKYNTVSISLTWFGEIIIDLIYPNNEKIKLGRQITCEPTAENVPLREQGVLLDVGSVSTFKTIFDGVLFLEYFNKLCKEEFGNVLLNFDFWFGATKEINELDSINQGAFQKLVNMFCDNMKLIFGNRIPPVIFPELYEDKEWYEYY